MTKSDINEYLHTLFTRLFDFLENHSVANLNSSSTSGDGFDWYLIVKSGNNMVKSSQEGLTGNEVLKTHHPAGQKWSDQFIYFGTVLEVDLESLGGEVESLEDISGTKLFTTFKSDLDLDLDPDVVMVENLSNHKLDWPRTKWPQRKCQRVATVESEIKFKELDLGNTEGVEFSFNVPALTSFKSLKNSNNNEQNGVAAVNNQIDGVLQLESETFKLGLALP
ncbi:hypothetical protein EDB19DRAFT_1826887 [Suillus lakei]|nr:hypothetical protein EDB19DRAFT_1826887 [Suillus lakei]